MSNYCDLPGGLRLSLRRWTSDDLGLMTALNAPEMTEHIGGPETEEKVRERLRSYVREPDDGRKPDGTMFVIEVTGTAARAGNPGPAGAAAPSGTAALSPAAAPAASIGGIGFWPLRWAGQDICETGWAVLPSHQGLGVASAAAGLVVARARAARLAPSLHAFPSVRHPASNAVCRKAGFSLVGPAEFEYPKGHLMQVNDWSIAL